MVDQRYQGTEESDMVRVELYSTQNGHANEPAATIIADGAGRPAIEGPHAELVDLEAAVLSVSGNGPVHWHDDAEEWARSLVTSYRGPYLLAQTVHDDQPPPVPQDEPLVIRQRVRR